ncbi:MAG: hypothetical protein QM578_25785 [Pantoea sp.]|uniref:hypothetical protein n=1 Tax=Pantoea sp. TaxID=69393 RepID=UPI0039E6BF32
MITATTAMTIAKHNEWADNLLFSGLLTRTEYRFIFGRKDTFKNIVNLMSEAYERALLCSAQMAGEEIMSAKYFQAFGTELLPLIDDQRSLNSWFVTWASEQDSWSFRKRCTTVLSDGRRARITLGDLFLNMAEQRSFYRGRLIALITSYEIKLPPLDMLSFLAESERGQDEFLTN